VTSTTGTAAQDGSSDLVCEVSAEVLDAAWERVEAISRSQRRRMRIKRLVDLPVAMLGLAATAPLMLTVAAALAVDLRENPFLRQQRAGRLGRPFGLLKLKTMRTRFDALGDLLPNEQRRSWVGDQVRKLSIDELPQLLNVVLGDLALVGPRPLWQEYVACYRLDELPRLAMCPGITGLAQVSGRNSVGWDERFALDTQYCLSDRLIGDDLIIALRTLGQALRVGETKVNQAQNLVAARGHGAFSPPVGYQPDRCPPELMAPSERSSGRRTRRRWPNA